MSKRYMPSLDALDAGESPVLGILDREALAELESGDALSFAAEDDDAGAVSDLFDPYE